jgi:hypothetical protein
VEALTHETKLSEQCGDYDWWLRSLAESLQDRPGGRIVFRALRPDNMLDTCFTVESARRRRRVAADGAGEQACSCGSQRDARPQSLR